MQISGQESIRFLERHLLGIQGISGATPVSRTGSEQPTERDRVEISARGKESQSLLQLVAALPEVRSDRVNEIRQRIETGHYRVNDRQVAANLVRTALMDAVL